MCDCAGSALDNGGSGGGGSSSGPGTSSNLDVLATPATFAAAALTVAYSYSMPADTMTRDGDSIEVEIFGNLLANTVNPTWFVGISLGGVVLWGAVSVAHAADADRKPHRHVFRIVRTSNTTCTMGGVSQWNNNAALPIAGLGNPATAPQAAPVVSVNVDPVNAGFNTALLVEVAVQPSAVGNEWVRKYASTTLYRAP